MQQPHIKFSDYSFQYTSQAKPTLNNISLSIYPGEKVLIVGPSGCGKSTLVNCINGIVPFSYDGSSTGTLTVFGKESKKQSLFELSKVIGTVLQDPDGQFIGLTVAEDIAFSLENAMVDQQDMIKETDEAARLVDIQDHLDSSPQELSGGQKQRVSLAGVLVDNVPILLFDEPLANLDPATGTQTIALIDKIKKESAVTIIIIEHRLEDALYREVDRIIVMDGGRIVADKNPHDIISSTILTDVGIREPLYISALKYAGVNIAKEKKPAYISTLELTQEEKEKVNHWFVTTKPPKEEVKNQLLLEANDIGFSYDSSRVVLQDISFKINKGEIAAIVGSNGAGKSTLSKLICGFEHPDVGGIFLEGKDLIDDTITKRAEKIGYVMQNPNQMISKTMIFDEVSLGLLNLGLTESKIQERVESTLKVCGLYPFRNWPISALSFGQKKRVTIASVLALRPDIIILDEPTAGQDFRHYTEIMEFLEVLNKQDVTIIMITHDMHLMLEYASHALVFSDSRLIADTSTAHVLSSKELSNKASLTRTSLHWLAKICGITKSEEFVQHFIDYDRGVRHGKIEK